MKFRSIGAWVIIASLYIVLIYGGRLQAATLVHVRWVDDGDTIVLADGRRIRYIGINAPEIGRDDKKSEPLGPEAGSFNRQMVFQKYVRLEFDAERIDHYGRSLAYVFSSADLFINKELLLNGFGHYLYRYPNVRYHAVLLEAQRIAMNARKGIWQGLKEEEGYYIGNKNSRRFHLGSCPLAQKILPDNRVYFTKMRDAFWEGYSPGKNCLPGGHTK